MKTNRKASQSQAKVRWVKPVLERLEDRTLLSVSPYYTQLGQDAALAESYGTSLAGVSGLAGAIPFTQNSFGDVTGLSSEFQALFSKVVADVGQGSDAAIQTALQNDGFSVSGPGANGPLTLTYSAPVSQLFPSFTVTPAGQFVVGSYFSGPSGSLQFASGATGSLSGNLSLTFGEANVGGTPTFFINAGNLFQNAAFSATVHLADMQGVQIASLPYKATVSGDVQFSIPFNVSLTSVSGSGLTGAQVASHATPTLAPGGNAASIKMTPPSGQTTNVFPQILGVNLLQWGADVTYAIKADGTYATPQVGSGIAIHDAQFGSPSETDIEAKKKLAKNFASEILPSDPFGILNNYNIPGLGSLTQTGSDLLQNVVDGLSTIISSLVGNQQFNPTNFLDKLSQAAQGDNPSADGFTFHTDNLLAFAKGQPNAPLVTFAWTGGGPQAALKLSTGKIPLGEQAAFIVTFTESLSVDVVFTPTYSFQAGLDANGAFIDTNPQDTFIQASTDAGPVFFLDVSILQSADDENGAPIATLAVAPDGQIISKLTLQRQPGQADPNKLYVSEILNNPKMDFSSTQALGTYLSGVFNLGVTTSGNVLVGLDVNSLAGVGTGTIPIPDGLRTQIDDLVQNSEVGSLVNSFKNNVVQPLIQGVDAFTSGLGSQISDKASEQAQQFISGSQLLTLLDGLFSGKPFNLAPAQSTAGVDVPQFTPTQPPSIGDLQALSGGPPSGFKGAIHHTFLDSSQTVLLQGDYTWKFVITSSTHNFGQADIIGASSPQGAAAGSSAAADIITFNVTGDTLNIIGTNDSNDVRVIDLGNHKIELVRNTTFADGTSHADPVRILDLAALGVMRLNVSLFRGNNDFRMGNSLFQPTSVSVEDGNNTIQTGSGDNTITFGSGNNNISTGDGNDTVTEFDHGATSGNNQVTLGEGTDQVSLGNGNNVVVGPSAVNPRAPHAILTFSHVTIDVGRGDNTLIAGDGIDVHINGGGGNNLFEAGAGTDVLDGFLDKNDFFVGGDGAATMIGGTGINYFVAGTGSDTMDGGAGTNVFLWADGAGNLMADGGGGTGLLIAVGANAGNDFSLTANGIQAILSRTVPTPNTLTTTRIQTVLVGDGAGPSSLTVGDLSGTALTTAGGGVAVAFSTHGAAVADAITLTGKATPASIDLSATPSGFLDVKGLAAEVLVAGTSAGASDVVTVNGNSSGDTFTVHQSAPVPANLVINGTGGSNTLALDTPDDNVWRITGQDRGTVNDPAITFSSIQNLTGGTGNDAFVFSDGAGVPGTVDGGGGRNTLDYHLYSTPITVNLQTGAATGTGGFKNIQNLIGGAGSDKLIGADTPNTWHITGPNAGDVNGAFTFSSIENLTGGALNDAFVFSDGMGVDGIVNGGGGSVNTLDYHLYSAAHPITVNLQTDAATGTGGFAHIQNLIGGAGSDTLIGADMPNTWHVTGKDQGDVNGAFTFSSIEDLIGGSGADAFVFVPGGRENFIDGKGGSDTLDFTAFTDTMGAALTGRGGVDGFDGVTTALGTGFADIEAVFGGQASDVIYGLNVSSLWYIDALSHYQAGGRTLAFKSFETIVGGAASDAFLITGVAEPTAVYGLGGDDTFVVANVPNIKAVLYLNGGGQPGDSLTVNDRAGGAPRTVTFTASTIGATPGDTLFGPGGLLYYVAFQALAFLGGPFGNTVNLTSKVAGTSLDLDTGAGNDVVNVSVGRDSNYSNVLVNGEGGADVLNDNDVAGGAVMHNHPGGPGMGDVSTHYLAGQRSFIDYVNVGAVLTNPDADHSFVQALYHQFDLRDGTPAEVNAWVAVLRTTGNRFLVVNGITRSLEALDVLAKGWYTRYYGRPAFGGEEAPYVMLLLQGQPQENVLALFLNSPEYFARAGFNDVIFVWRLYLDLVGRPPSAVEMFSYLESIEPRLGRGGMAWILLVSPEYRADAAFTVFRQELRRDEIAPADVRFPGLLQRPAPSSGDIIGAVFSGLDLTTMQEAFASGQEFYDWAW